MRRRSCGWNGLKHGYTLGARGGSTREVDLESVVGRLRAIFYGEEGEKGETVKSKRRREVSPVGSLRAARAQWPRFHSRAGRNGINEWFNSRLGIILFVCLSNIPSVYSFVRRAIYMHPFVRRVPPSSLIRIRIAESRMTRFCEYPWRDRTSRVSIPRRSSLPSPPPLRRRNDRKWKGGIEGRGIRSCLGCTYSKSYVIVRRWWIDV